MRGFVEGEQVLKILEIKVSWSSFPYKPSAISRTLRVSSSAECDVMIIIFFDCFRNSINFRIHSETLSDYSLISGTIRKLESDVIFDDSSAISGTFRVSSSAECDVMILFLDCFQKCSYRGHN